MHVSCDFIDGVVSSDIFDVGEQHLFLEERAAVDGACFQIEAWQAIDVVLDMVEG